MTGDQYWRDKMHKYNKLPVRQDVQEFEKRSLRTLEPPSSNLSLSYPKLRPQTQPQLKATYLLIDYPANPNPNPKSS